MTIKQIKFLCGIPHTLSDCGEYYEADKNSEEWKKYRTGVDYQTEQWLLGNPIMNKWHENPDYWESCPDFSNEGSEIWPYELRLKFINSSDEIQQEMCMMSLSNMLAEELPDLNLYIANTSSTELTTIN